jgi:CHASE1-domain containing sensor protein
MAGNELALGYDLGSQPPIQNLLFRTHEVGGAEVSGPLRLPYNQTVKMGVMAAMPVYSPDFVPDSTAERVQQNQGFVVAVFIIDELMRAITARTPDLRLDVMLLDATQSGEPAVLGASLQGKAVPISSFPELGRFRTPRDYTHPQDIGGRKMVLDFRRSAGWDRGSSRWVPASAFCIGLLLTGIMWLVRYLSK